ncbi:WD40 repeat-like protein, partial [Eremomyces bilateralis CBS 781.70]
VSFLSRIIGNKKRGALPTHGQDASDPGDGRPEGMDAHLFSHSTDNVGFSPQYPQPPQYIKVRSKFKREKEIDHLFLSQQLRGGHQKATTFPLVSRTATEIASHTQAREDPVWALEFSKDGKYLAAAGHDKTVRVWAVISSPEERRDFEDAGSPQGGQGASPSPLRAPVFHPTPFRLYEGHESTVIDLSWSKNNFLLSSSFDKTVRLWHISRNECLCTFKHAEYVPSIQFHPRDDRFFLAGSLDLKLRLWSIPDKSVAFWAQLPEMITAVAFTPDGKSCIAGTLGGQLHFYETDNLKYSTHIHVRSNRGKKSRGSKITNIQAMNFPPDKPYGNLKILVSSNDSRVRLYNMRDKSLQAKFKGHVNNETQIRATFSDDGRYVVSGSEDKKTHIWSIDPGDAEKGEQPLEVFESNSSMTIASLLAPTKTRQALSASEDPIYDLCNPPPVTLVSRTESIHSSRPPTESENGQEIPSGETTTNRTAGSPAYVARNVHPGGHIIVTAEYSGSIRVYRQDCAYMK